MTSQQSLMHEEKNIDQIIFQSNSVVKKMIKKKFSIVYYLTINFSSLCEIPERLTILQFEKFENYKSS